ncbi:MAG: hypothetical protein IJ426_04545 [Clostridia bacterium]|nr:hypothetical protein [Clostridia bacterium]
MNKRLIKALCFICCLSLMLSILSACGSSSGSKEDKKPYLTGTTTNVESTVGLAENDKFRLDWDAEVANVTITDKATGYVYSQIPLDYLSANRELLTVVNNSYDPEVPIPDYVPDEKSVQLYSPMFINTVMIATDASATLYASIDAYKRGRVGSEKIDGGIRVTYYFDTYQMSVPVDYTITEEGFNMSVVPTDIIEGMKDYYVLSVGLSPMMCSVKNDAGNYVIVPSGSGALMYTDSRGDGTPRTFSGEVYGDDPAVEVYEKLSNKEESRLPVFGAVEGNRAVCAIIESGAEKAVINAQVGDASLGLSSAYITCFVRGYNRPVSTILAGRIRIRTHVQDALVADEPITVSYHVLSGEQASYSGIAKYYREWLVKNKGMKTSAEGELLYAQVAGGFETDELFLGLPYKDTRALTTYGEATEIAKKLYEISGGSMVLNMVGFGTTGVSYGEVGGGFDLTGASGGKKALKKFLSACEEIGISPFFNFDVVRFKSASSGLGETAVTANNAAAKQYVYDRSTKLRQTSNYHYLLQRAELGKAVKKAMKVVNKYDIPGIALDSLGSIAYSDYVQGDYYNKAGMAAQVTELFGTIRESEKSILTNQANDYAAVISDVILDVPTGSNMNVSIDKDVPFYQMVFKGYVDIANEAINTATNSRVQFLHAMETGTGLSFVLTEDYTDETVLAGEAVFYATVFEDNVDTITEMVNEAKAYLTAVKSAKISAHSNPTNTVSKTVFDNGVSVYVNFGDNEVTVENVKIPANDFVALGEGGTVIG